MTVRGWHWEPWMDELLRSEYAEGVASTEIAKRLGRTPEAIRRRASRLGIRSKFQTLQIRHGISRYKHGCRCDICRAANTEAHRRYTASARTRAS